ncbi:MAG: polysaccharide biosynthesis/export family protein [Gemmatimonadetes bacterium]|nr:polysaccharide biosynthesis/export family protein [Gemmatimonadota bacterium]MDA1102237.1 polysaccharide biosynthesis/export family protein [Gemmatimonadota bacterium]
MNRKIFLVAMTTIALTVACAAALPAQVSFDADPGSSVRTRQDLEGLLELYEQVLQSPAYSEGVKRATRVKLERIRERLTDGDFKLGDRVVLSVEGEPGLPDTVPVQAGPMITLPLFGDIQLSGVLRSEIGMHITEALKVFIRDPVVRAEGLMRVSVQGAVGQPGFFVVPADMLLSETLMIAGGPAPNSNLSELRIERGTELVMGGGRAAGGGAGRIHT